MTDLTELRHECVAGGEWCLHCGERDTGLLCEARVHAAVTAAEAERDRLAADLASVREEARKARRRADRLGRWWDATRAAVTGLAPGWRTWAYPGVAERIERDARPSGSIASLAGAVSIYMDLSRGHLAERTRLASEVKRLIGDAREHKRWNQPAADSAPGHWMEQGGMHLDVDDEWVHISWTEDADNHDGTVGRNASVPTEVMRATLARIRASEG